MSRRGERGSASIEAAIALPVFICVAVAFAFLLRCVQVHELVQHAITQAAADIAESSYIYDVAGLLDFQRDIEGVGARARAQAETVVSDAFQLDNWLPAGAADVAGGSVAGSAFDAVQGFVNGAVFSAFARDATKKYLCAAAADIAAGVPPPSHGDADSAAMVDSALRRLSVIDGFHGLYFDQSAYLDSDDDVVIHVRYRLKVPIFIKALSVIEIRQQASARAWLFGERRVDVEEEEEEAAENETAEEEGDTIWSLSNFERGRKIREIFGGNLPSTFPGISGYSNGEALLIKSLDATAASYQDSSALKRTINGYVKNLASYAGQARPWGQDGITIPPEGITSRRLVLVIPTNELPESLESAIAACVSEALARGVELQVERYERKIVKTEAPEPGTITPG